MKAFLNTVFFLILGLSLFGQEEKIMTDLGNKALELGDLNTAKQAYESALEIDPDYKEAQFNLGNVYQQEARGAYGNVEGIEDPQEKQAQVKAAQELSKKAASQFEQVASNLTDDSEINKAKYNLGNAQLLAGEVDKSIDAYKEALRKDPNDEDARYNLAYAQHLKKKQEQQQDQQQDQENQDQQDQEQNQENQENQDQQQDQNQEEQQQQQRETPQLSKEEAEKMLEALMKQEKELQEDLQKKKLKGQRVRIEKDW